MTDERDERPESDDPDDILLFRLTQALQRSRGSRPPSYAPTDVLSPSQVREALQLSERQFERKRHLLPFSRVFGEHTLRITWSQVLDTLEGKTSAVLPDGTIRGRPPYRGGRG